MEAAALTQITETPSLPGNGAIADQISRNAFLAIRVKAFGYSLFWTLSVQLAVSAILARAHYLYSPIDATIALLCYIFAGGYLTMYGLFNGVYKRLYIEYIIGFRDAKNDLIKGCSPFQRWQI